MLLVAAQRLLGRAELTLRRLAVGLEGLDARRQRGIGLAALRQRVDRGLDRRAFGAQRRRQLGLAGGSCWAWSASGAATAKTARAAEPRMIFFFIRMLSLR
jgi:hypothetical protein